MFFLGKGQVEKAMDLSDSPKQSIYTDFSSVLVFSAVRSLRICLIDGPSAVKDMGYCRRQGGF